MTHPSTELRGLDIAGFDQPVFDAASVFRAVLAAMSRPGEIIDMTATVGSPATLNKGASAVVLTLCDMETALWLAPEVDAPETRQFLTFQTGCRFVDDPKACDFAVASAATNTGLFKALPIGTPEYPDRSATLIVLADTIAEGSTITLSGPGIADKNDLSVSGLPDGLWTWFRANTALFPLGVDLILASDDHIAALPRSVNLEEAPCMLP